jgi:transcriptional regulator with XRE-family HTH domain
MLMDYNKIGMYIQNKRKEKSLTQKELAKKLFLTDKAISKWERGLGCPDVSVLEDLSNILGVSILSILNGEDTDLQEADTAVYKAVSYSKESGRNNFKNAVTNLLFIIICFVTCFLIFANISHIMHLNKLNEVVINYSFVDDSIKLVEDIDKNIELINSKELIYSNDDMKYIIDGINSLYNDIVKHDFYKLTGDKVYSMEEVYNILNKERMLNSIALVRKIDEYDSLNIVDVESYIDYTLLRMLNKQNLYDKIASLDVYPSVFDFKGVYNVNIDQMVLTLDFRTQVRNLYSLTNYVLIIGEKND